MRQSDKSLKSNSIYWYRRYLQQMLVVAGVLLFSLTSNSIFALAPNPGATCTGIVGASQGSLTNADYSSLASAVNNNNYVTVAGNAAGSIPLQIRISTTESSTSTIRTSFGVISPSVDGSTVNAINVGRNFPSPSDSTEITLEFRNDITTQPIFLTNVALSAFDVDFANSNNNLFDDLVQITGTTVNGSTITGSFQSITGSNVVNVNNTLATGLNNSTATNCPAKNLDTRCQGSVQFSQAVDKVTIRYTNNRNFIDNTPTNQEIDFRVDNYCYVPQYIFSGTVFDDNGGITAGQASATNANITTGVYANNANYFNGVFNSPPELGISGSTVRLASCSNTATTYATQSVAGSGATIGQYQFSVPISTFGTNRSICLIESRTGTAYPIRTTTDNINTGFATTTYNYANNNFGRVIAANAALVLRKAQYVNDCSSPLTYTATNLNTPGNTNPRAGFSESAIGSANGNALTPGQCIAYRITATNRANTPITNFVMQDKLQVKGEDNALVTSVLANPVANTTDYASDSVAIGQNGLVKTNPFTLGSRSNRNFYFNTKYGTTN